MSLNPLVVIPTYWSGRRSTGSLNRGPVYDHMTPIDKEGELARCLESLVGVAGLGRIALLVVAEPGVENQAVEKVRSIAARFNALDIVVVGEPELRHIHRQMEQMGLGAFSSAACLSGYGAIRNLGVLVASIFGHDTIVFLDDDEVVLSGDFLTRALYGVAMQTPSGEFITAKTGFFIDQDNNYTAPANIGWYDRFWNRSRGFNEYIEPAIQGPRLTRSNVACGGCMVLHADAYGRVAFDPWITRGEDLDFLLSASMYGLGVWFDNQLAVRHLPPETNSPVMRFTQDVYRWFYEVRKIEFGKTQIDLMQVNPKSLEPYPGPWLTHSIARRARFTALLRTIACPEHGEYWRVATKELKEASVYARDNCSKYFEFQHEWPGIVRALWNNTPVATQLSGARQTLSSNAAFTGRFAAVRTTESAAQKADAFEPSEG